MADFYPAFDKRFILNVEPWEQLHRLQNREHGYKDDDPELQRKIVEEQAQLVANASQIWRHPTQRSAALLMHGRQNN